MKKNFKSIALFLLISALFSNCVFAARTDYYSELEKKKSSEMTTDQFLDLVEYKAFLYFWNEANPQNGLVKDRAKNFQQDLNKSGASVAAVGFGLSAVCVAQKRGWITYKEARDRVLNTLLYFRDKIYNNHGFFYHFVDMNTGERAGINELSSIDTTLFLAGALFAGEYFGGDIKKIANEIYERVDWQWMMAGGSTLNMGWYPESGFLDAWWNNYCEDLILYLLAIGSPTHPIPASIWDNVSRKAERYAGYTSIECGPLFTHQYSHVWVDFRGIHDAYADYFENSVYATLANRAYCVDEFSKKFRTYSENVWGLTAGDGPDGYKAYGGSPRWFEKPDGTVLPTAPAGSIVFTPELSIAALKYMYDNYKDRIWGKYGFSDSFNLDRNWVASDALGIDEGPIVLMIENYRSGMVWKYFMRNKCIKDAMKAVGFIPNRKLPPSLAMMDIGGKWKISKGDDLAWKKPEYDDSNWAEAEAGKMWEDAVYPGYDGYAWYRKTFEISKKEKKVWEKEDIVFQAGGIDDVDSVYLNGKKIGGLGQFPPLFKTAYDKTRIYRIPKGLINYGEKNTISIRVFDETGAGGIVSGPVRLGPLVSIQYKPIVYIPAEMPVVDIAFKTDRKDYKSDEEMDIPVWILNNTDEEIKQTRVSLELKNVISKQVALKKDFNIDLKGDEYQQITEIEYKFPEDIADGATYGLEAQLRNSEGDLLKSDTAYFKVIKVVKAPEVPETLKPVEVANTYDLSGKWVFIKGWYRINFKIPDEFAAAWRGKESSILVEAADSRDEIYLNKTKISGKGKERLYPIPPYKRIFWFIKRPVFNLKGDNEIAVRLYAPEGRADFVRASVKIGPLESLR